MIATVFSAILVTLHVLLSEVENVDVAHGIAPWKPTLHHPWCSQKQIHQEPTGRSSPTTKYSQPWTSFHRDSKSNSTALKTVPLAIQTSLQCLLPHLTSLTIEDTKIAPLMSTNFAQDGKPPMPVVVQPVAKSYVLTFAHLNDKMNSFPACMTWSKRTQRLW